MLKNKINKIFLSISVNINNELFLMLMYFRNHYSLPRYHKPKTLNDHIINRKIFENGEIYSCFVDKYAVREYIENTVGSHVLIPLLFVTDNADDLSCFRCKDGCVIKPNHLSGQVMIFDHFEYETYLSCNEKLRKWINSEYYLFSREKQYKNIKPKILVEKKLVNKDGTHPHDYKFHCFNGSAEFVQVDSDRFTNHKRVFYDKNWNKLNFTWSRWRNGEVLWNNDLDIKRPKYLDAMLDIAEKLSSKIRYVRIDLYETDNAVYFGEITLYPGGGYERFYPKYYDYLYGALLQ